MALTSTTVPTPTRDAVSATTDANAEAVDPLAATTPAATTTSLHPSPDTTTTTIVFDTMPSSTTEQPQPSPVSRTWAPVLVLTGDHHPERVSVAVGDTIALFADLSSGPPPVVSSSPQNSFGVDPYLLRVIAYAGDCPVGAFCAAWIAVDAGTSPIETTILQPNPCQLDGGATAETTSCSTWTTSVSIGIDQHPVSRIGPDADGTSIAVPVGAFIDIHLDEVSTRMYPAGAPATPEYWNAPTATNPGALVAIGQEAPTLCTSVAFGRHDCLSLVATEPGMTTLTLESGYTCDVDACSPTATSTTQTFTLTVAVTPN